MMDWGLLSKFFRFLYKVGNIKINEFEYERVNDVGYR